MVYEVIVGGKAGGKAHRLELEKAAAGWECRLDGQPVHIDAVIPRRDVLSLLVDGRAYEIKREQTATDLHLWVGSSAFFALAPDDCGRRKRAEEGSGSDAWAHRASAGRGEFRS